MRGTVGLVGLVVVGIGIAAGCGGGGGGGAPKSASVTVQHPAPSQAGEKFAIVVNDSAGRLVSSVEVTTSGANDVVVPSHGSVTFAIALGTSAFTWSTVVEPPTGTTLSFVDLLAAPSPTPAAFQTWNVTLSSAPATATNYRVIGPCGDATAATTAAAVAITTSNCRDASAGKILAVAFDAGGNAVGWHESDALPAAPGVTTNVAVAFDRTTRALTSWSFMNLPPDVTYVAAGIALDDPLFQHTQVTSANTSVPSGSAAGFLNTQFVPIPSVALFEEALSQTGAIERIRHLPAIPGSVAFDLSNVELPSLPALDGPTGHVSWTAPDFGDGEVLLMELGNSTTQGIMEVAMPAGTEGFRIPELPPGYGPPVVGLASFGFIMEPDYASIEGGYPEFVSSQEFPSFSLFGLPSDDAVIVIGGVS